MSVILQIFALDSDQDSHCMRSCHHEMMRITGMRMRAVQDMMTRDTQILVNVDIELHYSLDYLVKVRLGFPESNYFGLETKTKVVWFYSFSLKSLN